MARPGLRIILGGVIVAALAWAALAVASATARPKATPSSLIVGLGDSLASGEGNPDTPAGSGKDAMWTDYRCDRSNKSFEAQLVARYRKDHPKDNVTFAFLACSGASIDKGLLGPYTGIHYHYWQSDLPAQVDAARKLAGKQKASAVLLSAGINDLRFGDVAYFCAKQGDDGYCPDETYSDGLTLAEWVKQELAAMPGRYDRLAAALKPLVDAGNVYVTEYPNEVDSAPGQLCKEIFFLKGYVYGRYVINARELKWLYDNYFTPLDAAIRSAAKKNGWNVVPAPQAFESHGYCTDDRWVVTYQESEDQQGDSDGTLHPNLKGQTAIADAFYKAMFGAGRRRPR